MRSVVAVVSLTSHPLREHSGAGERPPRERIRGGAAEQWPSFETRPAGGLGGEPARPRRSARPNSGHPPCANGGRRLVFQHRRRRRGRRRRAGGVPGTCGVPPTVGRPGPAGRSSACTRRRATRVTSGSGVESPSQAFRPCAPPGRQCARPSVRLTRGLRGDVRRRQAGTLRALSGWISAFTGAAAGETCTPAGLLATAADGARARREERSIDREVPRSDRRRPPALGACRRRCEHARRVRRSRRSHVCATAREPRPLDRGLGLRRPPLAGARAGTGGTSAPRGRRRQRERRPGDRRGHARAGRGRAVRRPRGPRDRTGRAAGTDHRKRHGRAAGGPDHTTKPARNREHRDSRRA